MLEGVTVNSTRSNLKSLAVIPGLVFLMSHGDQRQRCGCREKTIMCVGFFGTSGYSNS
jgi:hypothetical protein